MGAYTYIATYIQPAHQSTCALDFICNAIISQQSRLVKHNLHANSSVCVSICLCPNSTIAANHIVPRRPKHIQPSQMTICIHPLIQSCPYIHASLCPSIQHYAWWLHTHRIVRLYTDIQRPRYMRLCNHTYMPIYIMSIYIHTYNHCIYLYTYIPILRGKIKKRNPRTHAQEAGKIKPFNALAC